MNIQDLKETRIIHPKGHFFPLVFVDMSVPAAFVGAGATYAGRNIQQEWDNRKKKFSPVVHLTPFRLITAKLEERAIILNSVDDIKF